MRIQLPSGRELIYHEMALVESAYAFRSELAFMGPHPLSRKWTQQRTYGGKLVENITQAVARDVLAEGMLELHARRRHILGSVHDEVLLEADIADAEGLLEETLALLRTPPSWAEGLPVEAEGFVARRNGVPQIAQGMSGSVRGLESEGLMKSARTHIRE